MKKDKSKQPTRKAYRSSSTTPTPSLPAIDSTAASDVESSPPATWPDTNASEKAKDSTRESDAGDTDKSSHLEDSRPVSRAGSWDRWLDRVLSRTSYKTSAKKRTSYSYDSTASSVRSEYRSPTDSPIDGSLDSDTIIRRLPRPRSHIHRIRRLHEPHQDLIIEMREAKTGNPSSGSGIVALSGTRSVVCAASLRFARLCEGALKGQKVRIQMPDEEKPDIVARFLGYTEGSCSPMAYPLPSEEINNFLQSMYFAVRWSCKGFGWAAVSAFESMVSNQDIDTLRKTVKDVVSEFDNEAPEAAAVRSCLLYGLACRGEDIMSDPLCRVRLRKFAGSPLTALGELIRQRHFDARVPIYEVATSSTGLTEETPKPRRSATWDPFDVPQYGEARNTKNGKDRSTSVSSTKS
ncbi:hypothetical protein KC332_g2291 [Hortaea werneckii]|uniref:BTB domain-containing protein n=1 Tax=Hortaea werneckii EXF-2000 TaxID=1157616 RepID=A0A1Z5TA66_HORWE|nr:hypothetical protein KC358_g6824 [Hortaea werneckii]OTA32751.1 hypothetical protein BTJ68_06574 [Hortaea werneckii EXF-2000]KAI6838533.1 hypothetical protein KC342_g3998 [Hortaea werneckii]KAI6850896.1 hypothetical protein KC350_g1880 [Hortaea werneckii]KAI6942467.1 hypothetical protein KC341_g2212 [Hortaea werneckii]